MPRSWPQPSDESAAQSKSGGHACDSAARKTLSNA
jgi:hypothetical protein